MSLRLHRVDFLSFSRVKILYKVTFLDDREIIELTLSGQRCLVLQTNNHPIGLYSFFNSAFFPLHFFPVFSSRLLMSLCLFFFFFVIVNYGINNFLYYLFIVILRHTFYPALISLPFCLQSLPFPFFLFLSFLPHQSSPSCSPSFLLSFHFHLPSFSSLYYSF